MQTFFLVALSIFFTLPTTTAGDRVTRSLDTFTGVDISHGTEAVLIESDENKIDIEASNVDLKKIKTTVNDGVLTVSVNTEWWRLNWSSNRKIKVKIYHTKKINSVEGSGGARISTDHSLSAEQLTIDGTTGTTINLSIDSEATKIDVSGGAIVTLNGTSNMIEVDASGGAIVTGIELITQDATIDAGGGAIVKVTAQKSIVVEASGGAQVRYGGTPADTDIAKRGGASVSKM